MKKSIILISLLLSVFCIYTVSGYTGSWSNEEFVQTNMTDATGTGSGSALGVVLFNYVDRWDEFKSIKMFTPNAQISIANTTERSGYQSASLWYQGVKRSDGIFGYVHNVVDNSWYIYYFADTWNPPETSSQYISMQLQYDISKFKLSSTSARSGNYVPWNDYGICFMGTNGGRVNILTGRLTSEITNEWRNDYTITENEDDTVNIDITRESGGIKYWSNISLWQDDTKIIDWSYGYEDTGFMHVAESPYTIKVKDPYGEMHTYTGQIGAFDEEDFDLLVYDSSVFANEDVYTDLQYSGMYDLINVNYYTDDTGEIEQEYSFVLQGSNWYQYNETSEAYDILVDYDTVKLQSFKFSNTGSKKIIGNAYDTLGNFYRDEEIITVSSGAQKQVTINVLDASSNYFIIEPQVIIKRLDTGNEVTYYPATGTLHVMMYEGLQYNITVNKANYVSRTVIYTPASPYIKSIYLTPIYPEIEEKVVVEFEIRDYVTKTAIIGANINIFNSTGLDNQNGTTGATGFRAFYVNSGQSYTGAITKSGYNGAQTQFNITEDTRLPTIYLQPLITTTTTIQPTGTITPSPIETDGLGIIDNSTLHWWLVTLPASYGLTTSWVSWLLGLFIIMVSSIFVGGIAYKVAGGSLAIFGVIIGAVSGFFVNIGVGIWPLWLFFGFVAMVVLLLIYWLKKHYGE